MMPVAMCPPSEYKTEQRANTRIGVEYSPSPFLKKIDDMIEWFCSIPSQIEEQLKPKTRQIVLIDRMNMAQSFKLSSEEAELLLSDPNPLVRIELAWNEVITEEILIRLLKDRNSSVSSIAKIRLASLLNLAT